MPWWREQSGGIPCYGRRGSGWVSLAPRSPSEGMSCFPGGFGGVLATEKGRKAVRALLRARLDWLPGTYPQASTGAYV